MKTLFTAKFEVDLHRSLRLLLEEELAAMITLTDIENAHERIKSHVFRTPCYPSLFLSERIGAEVFLKLECFQPTGVFKIRGAFNIELENLEKIKTTGVITASSRESWVFRQLTLQRHWEWIAQLL